MNSQLESNLGFFSIGAFLYGLFAVTVFLAALQHLGPPSVTVAFTSFLFVIAACAVAGILMVLLVNEFGLTGGSSYR